MSIPPGYEYVLSLDIPVISLCCRDSSHPPAHAAIFGKQKTRNAAVWAPLAPLRLQESSLYSPELVSAIDTETNQPTSGSNSVDRYNIKCPWCPVTVPVRQVSRLREVLDQLIAVDHPDLYVDGVLSIPLASLAARLRGSGKR
ncbi:MAG: hypothetical protein K0U84_05695 [Actinomycetia bacterium]|nr:hypothetical protein [Actinomycetes bacterium]